MNLCLSTQKKISIIGLVENLQSMNKFDETQQYLQITLSIGDKIIDQLSWGLNIGEVISFRKISVTQQRIISGEVNRQITGYPDIVLLSKTKNIWIEYFKKIGNLTVSIISSIGAESMKYLFEHVPEIVKAPADVNEFL